MKNIFIGMFVIFLLSISGCGGGGGSGDDSGGGGSTTSTLNWDSGSWNSTNWN